MKRFWILRAMKFVVFAIAFVLVGGYIIMSLWNWLIPSILTGNIGFTQAIGILVLMRILFGGFGRHGWSRGYGSEYGWHHNWRQRMEERMANMTPEQKEQFKQQMKDRWKNGCGHWDKEEKTEKV
jgi:hypothetical protein